jgi:hypothetical protein
MEHQRFKAKGENIDIFFYGANENKFKLYKINNDKIMSEITPTVNISSIGNDTYKQNVTLPDEDCIVFSLFNNEPIFLRVGNPTLRVYVYFPIEQTVPYERYEDNGSLIESGNMEYLDNGVYCFTPSDIEYSIINIMGNQITLDVPYSESIESSGTIVINNNTWNNIAINVEDMRVSDFINEIGSDNVEIANAFNNGAYQNFIVGVTNIGSSNDFYLVRDDNGTKEIQPFLLKVKNIGNDITYEWGN